MGELSDDCAAAAAADADRWRQQLLACQREAEALRLRIVAAEAGRADASEALETLRTGHEALEQQLAEARETSATLAVARRELLAGQAEAAEAVQRAEQSARQLAARAADAEGRLNAVYQSVSWRLTGPLRGVRLRHPALAGRLRRLLDGAGGGALPLLRGSWRLLTLRPVVPPMASKPAADRPAAALAAPDLPSAERLEASAEPPTEPPAEPAPAPLAGPDADTAGRHWFYLGDLFAWLQAEYGLTGVGRVTAELFFASVRQAGHARMLPCALAPVGAGLGSVSLRDSLAYLGARTGTHGAAALLDALDSAAAPPATEFTPILGDHVLFPGLVWGPNFLALFRRLRARGIRFSVFVYDIIPMEHPEFVTDWHRLMFAEWLETVLALASVVFVSGEVVRDQILRWAVLAGVPVAATLVAVPFGAGEAPADDAPLPAGVRAGGFVLSVGTIDRRKNQALLCRLWPLLIAELGRDAVPQLVLVGREDAGLAAGGEAVAGLLDSGDILVLQGVSDAELGGLYRACLFTAFPSLSEGYGLPVAESLRHGKLCIASDLAVIREHAGDLPWYFPPDDAAAALALLRRAIADPAARAAAEARIAGAPPCPGWDGAYRHIAAAVTEAPARPQPARVAPPRPDVPGLLAAPVAAALHAAQAWCTEGDPEVSILVLNWNASGLTLECLRQIWAHTTGVRYEVVIADNGSAPEDVAALASLGRGVRLLPLGANRFFGEANNIAAEHASGRMLCLLNNDAFVTPGWLPALLDGLATAPRAGAAGPLFLFPDGRIQEAGGTIDPAGYPVRGGRGEQPEAAADVLVARDVDYISAAALLVRREVFMAAGGFDLAFEPAYYEDADLCFRIRALGHSVRFCPAARVVHAEGAAANGSSLAEARRAALGDLNRDKFTSRWGSYLRGRAEPELRRIALQEAVGDRVALRTPTGARPTAALFTPYALTPGGGERFLLTAAAVLARCHAVTLVTPHPYSRLRLANLAHQFGIDLSAVRLTTQQAFAAAPAPDLLLAMGNAILPPIPARCANSVFLCQFPFPPLGPAVELARPEFDYRAIVTYSEYARAHILAGLSAQTLPALPVHVLHPPSPQLAGDAGAKRRSILSVGRFFAGGHSKRHDLLIHAFRTLHERLGPGLELHLAGSSTPVPEQMDYLGELRRRAEGLPVTFHVNAAPDTLSGLYRDAAIYWHASGMGAELATNPGAAEHFGISIVEAMSAQCAALAFNAGGPREIITQGVDGFLFATEAELIDITERLLGDAALRQTVGRAAGRRAAQFSPDAFADRLLALLCG